MATSQKKYFPLLEPNLADTLSLTRVFKNTPLLDEWLNATSEIDDREMYLYKREPSKIGRKCRFVERRRTENAIYLYDYVFSPLFKCHSHLLRPRNQ